MNSGTGNRKTTQVSVSASPDLRTILGSMFVSSLIIGALNLIFQILFARILGPEVIADYATTVVAINLIVSLTSFGINQGVIARGFTARRFQNALTLVLAQLGIMTLSMAALAFAIYVMAPERFFVLWKTGLLIALAAIALPVANVFNIQIEYRLQYKKFAIIRLVSFVAANLSAGALLLLGMRAYVLPIRDFVNSATLLVISFTLLSTQIKLRFDRPILGAIASATRSIWLSNLATLGSARLDFAIVGACVNPIAFAVYFQTRNLATGILAFVSYPVQSSVFAYMRRHRDRLRFDRILAITGYVAIGAAAIAVFISWATGERIVVSILGQKWRAGSVLLAPLAIYASASLYGELLSAVAKALNRMHAVLWARVVNIVIVAVAVPLATLAWGIQGGGWASAAATAVMALAGAWLLWPTLTTNRPIGPAPMTASREGWARDQDPSA